MPAPNANAAVYGRPALGIVTADKDNCVAEPLATSHSVGIGLPPVFGLTLNGPMPNVDVGMFTPYKTWPVIVAVKRATFPAFTAVRGALAI